MSQTIKKAVRVDALQHCIEPLCGERYALDDRLYVCRRCGGLLDIEQDTRRFGDAKQLQALWAERLASFDERDLSGVWRYRELLPFADDAPLVTLVEGNTPLYNAPRAAAYCGLDRLVLKHQGYNPTGSFKDTGMATAITQAVILGTQTVVCASTGNTSASLAAYATRAGLRCAILLPHGQISNEKLAQSLDYGATVLELDGNFDNAMRVSRELAEDESIYLVNSINPFRIEGQKTVAAELLQQRGWRVPDHVIVPGGNLGNVTAFGKGFKELFDLGMIDRLPRLSVVQAEGAAPFADMVARGSDVLEPVKNPQTLATAINIGAPVSWKKAIRAVSSTDGFVLSVSEQEIADAKAIIGRDGIGCEPASATTVAGLKRLVADGRVRPEDDAVAVLTGNILKDADYVINYHQNTLFSVDGSPEKTQVKHRLADTYSNPPIRVKATKTAILEHLKLHESKTDY